MSLFVPQRKFLAAILFAAFVVCLPLAAFADLTPVNPESATQVARNWLQYSRDMQWSASLDASAPALQEIFYEGQLVGYAAAQNSGYVVIPAYRELPPISAYSTTSTFRITDEGGFVQMVKEELAGKINVARTVSEAAQISPEMLPAKAQIEKDLGQWDNYSADYAQFSRAMAAENAARPLDDVMEVAPLLLTNWDQGVPFNNFCPMGDGGRSAVGCVATAASQILAYWRYPAYGAGSHSYTWSGDQSCGGSTASQTLSATYSDAYDWTNILNNYDVAYNQAQADAAAELCYEVATALNMDFGYCGSGASTSSVASIMTTYFGMATGTAIQYRTSYATADAWFALLQTDLNLGRPMQYRIQSHSIVCDGWRVYGGNQIHLNYGWDDGHTAWYTIDNLYCAWTGCGPSQEYVVRNIHPASGGGTTPSLTLSAPNGGENWNVGSAYAIQWSSANFSDNVTIELNRAYPAGSWETLFSGSANDGVQAWTVSGAATSSARIRIRGTTATTVGDTSAANFSLVSAPPPVPGLTVTAPNGGENWVTGSAYNVTWTSQYLSGNVMVELNRSYPSGTWETLVTGIANTGSWAWSVSGTTTTAARVRVRGMTQAVGDTSNTNFTISAPSNGRSITVSSPNGGEVLSLGAVCTVQWSSVNAGNSVRIYLNRNYPTGVWEAISGRTSNSGSYTWAVSGATTMNARIRITGSASTIDESDGNFQIIASQAQNSLAPLSTTLVGAYPNPFNPSTQIRFELAAAGHVTLEVFDISGRQVATLLDGEQTEGTHRITFDGNALSAGIYFVRLRAGDVQSMQKIQLIK